MKSFCQHLPRHHGSVIRADSDHRWIKHCYSSTHVTPIKLWVVEMVYVALGVVPAPFTLYSSALRLDRSVSTRRVLHLALFVSLQDKSVKLLFPLSHTWTSSSSSPQPRATAGVGEMCSLSVASNKSHVAVNDHSWQLISLTTGQRAS